MPGGSSGARTTRPSRAFFLTQRIDGVTSRVPVRPRSVPFDADLGPDVNGETVAAYSRCAREPRPRDRRGSET